MAGRIREFGLGLPEGWYEVPSGDVAPAWAADVAERALAGRAAPDGAVAALAAALLDVKDAVDATDLEFAHTAALVETTGLPVVQAMLTVVVGRQVSEPEYLEQLDHVAEGVEGASVVGRQPIEAHVPAGAVRGAHVLVGHLREDEDEVGIQLEERVHLAVFPEGSPDLVDVTGIAASVGVFADFPTFVVGLLEALEVTTGAGS
ncbi:hypothetical protein ACFT5B_05780 [Luteimicrobium sp. NPDC057192]|uniref:hypothetical protein n=1 Tax=Luteimicrobium sp. NPDC057192 TaxID=3346042 RepID=UPI0036390CEC